jgi:hypothetical protein
MTHFTPGRFPFFYCYGAGKFEIGLWLLLQIGWEFDISDFDIRISDFVCGDLIYDCT